MSVCFFCRPSWPLSLSIYLYNIFRTSHYFVDWLLGSFVYYCFPSWYFIEKKIHLKGEQRRDDADENHIPYKRRCSFKMEAIYEIGQNRREVKSKTKQIKNLEGDFFNRCLYRVMNFRYKVNRLWLAIIGRLPSFLHLNQSTLGLK